MEGFFTIGYKVSFI